MQLECAPFITCAAGTITTAMPPTADHEGGGALLSPASYPLLDRDESQEDDETDERPTSDDVDRSRRRGAPPGRSDSSSSRSPFVPGCYTWPPPQQRQDSKSKLTAKLQASTDSDEDDYVLYTDADDGSTAYAAVSTPAAVAPVTPTPSSDAFGCYSPPADDAESSVAAQVAIKAKGVPREMEPGFTDHSFAPPPPPSESESEDRPAPREEESAFALARKAAVGALGGGLVGVGAVMIPLPIPMGVVVVAAGMAVLGTEFPQAREVLVGARDNLATAVAHSPSEEVDGDDPDRERATAVVGGEEGEVGAARAGRMAAADLAAAGDEGAEEEDRAPIPSPCGCGEPEQEPEEKDGSDRGNEGLQGGQQPQQKKPSFHRSGTTTSTSSSAAPSLRRSVSGGRRGRYDDLSEDYTGVETAAREAKFALKRFGRKVLPLLDKLVQQPQPESATISTATATAPVGTNAEEAATTKQNGGRGGEASYPEVGQKAEEDAARPPLDDDGLAAGKRNGIEIGPSPTLATCVSASSHDDGSTSLICQRLTDDEVDR